MNEMLTMIDKMLHDEEWSYHQRIAVLRKERQRIIDMLVEQRMYDPLVAPCDDAEFGMTP